MKKYYIALACTLLTFSTSDAQVKFGLKGGIDLTNVMLDGGISKNLSADNTTGFFIGPMLDIKIPVIQLGVDASVLYNQKTFDIQGEKEKAHYINIPVNAKLGFGLGDFVGVFITTGPQISFNVGSDTFNFKDMESTATNFELSKSQFSWNIGAGVKLMNHFQVAYNYNIGFGPTGEFEYKEAVMQAIDGQLKNNSHQVSVAYIF